MHRPSSSWLSFGALFLALAASASPVRAEDPTNDVTLDMELHTPLGYPLGLSIINLYWDSDWDTHNPGFLKADINAATKALADSNYFDKIMQYGGPDITFGSSAEAAFFCGGGPRDTTITSVDLILFLLCEESAPGTGVPFSFGDHIYNVIVPTWAGIDDGVNKSCADYGAYHFAFGSLPGPFGVPPPGRPIIYTVIPAKCYADDGTGIPGLMSAISHEDVEAATDPAPGAFWFDDSTVDSTDFGTALGTALNPLKAGEAADICNGLAAVPVTFGGVNMTADGYWSNADNACVVGPSRVVNTTLDAELSFGIGTVNVSGVSHRTPYTEKLLEATTYSFPNDVADTPGKRWVQSFGDCSGTVAFPAGNTTADAAVFLDCSYSPEYFLTVNTSPGAAAIGNTTLTPSGWHVGTVPLSADADVAAAPGSRYDFRSWSVDGVPSGPSVVLTSPKTATAGYQLQHRIDFGQTGIPANGTAWHVTIDGFVQPGPALKWGNEGASVSYTYESTVVDALDPSTRYVLSGVTPASPLLDTAPRTVTGVYGTQDLLTVGTSGLGRNTTSVRNGASVLGTASDAAPVTAFLPAGTALSLSVDDPVAGIGGVEYFLQGFTPAPPGTLTTGFSTTASYATMARQIDDALASGQISAQNGAGVAGALKQKWAEVQADLAARNNARALTRIEEFNALLESQSGKKVTVGLARDLRLDALGVYIETLCRAVAIGQIGPATHAAKYAYYSALVTSLGGVPRSDC